MQRDCLMLLILLACAALALGGCQEHPSQPAAPQDERLTVAETVGGEPQDGFARALEPRGFVFPADHGPHPQFKTEWWYYTGNLQNDQGRRFGYQLTFFRIGLRSEPVERDSNWAADQVYMAHFALTDPGAEDFYHFERFSRGAMSLAGAQAEPFRVWLEDWSAIGTLASSLPMHLQATAGKVAIDLSLDSAKPIVLQGEQGVSQKSSEPGNASYYYSLTRMPTAGEVRIGTETFRVTGGSWLDREWSTSALADDQLGWDWFSLQFDDGRELMYYQLRLEDGRADPLSSGVLVAPDGSTTRLAAADLRIEALDHWQSPHSGGRYPARWRLRVPDQELELEIVPLLADQELQTSVRYWEGAVSLQGTSRGKTVRGHGYVELTGYAR